MLSQGLIHSAHLLNVCFQNELTLVAIEVLIPLDQLTVKPITTTSLKKPSECFLWTQISSTHSRVQTRLKQSATNIILWYHSPSTLHNTILFTLTVHHHQPLFGSSRSAHHSLTAHRANLCPLPPPKISSGKFSGIQNDTAISVKICNQAISQQPPGLLSGV